MNNSFQVSGWIVDIESARTYPGVVAVKDGRIDSIIEREPADVPTQFILPGFIDSHVHIESSMLVPSEFARIAVVHGTVATISDPHEIANVCGVAGVDYMIDNGNLVPFKFHFGAPSCVPATVFETAGATVTAEDVLHLLQREEINYLSEMMNFPGVLNNDQDVIAKISHARTLNKPVDGHAPGLRGDDARRYINAGISTDHECFTADEALDKLQCGMKILIREGSAARNFDALIDLMPEHYESMMFCSDDKHPDSLVEGHINQLCARAVSRGIDVYKILRAACINPVQHYDMRVGIMRKQDDADFIIVHDLKDFKTKATYIKGVLVAENGISLIERSKDLSTINNFNVEIIEPISLQSLYKGQEPISVIEAFDGQLITGKLMIRPKLVDDKIVSDPSNDVLKIVVVNRYKVSPPAIGFIKNFKLREGAIASSVAHDSHNIVAVGVDDESLCRAINLVIEKKGGVSCVRGSEQLVLPLPVAGLMSTADGYDVAKQYTAIDQMAKDCGSTLLAPFMTLSFMALLVIPHLKLSDKGMFDGDRFELID